MTEVQELELKLNEAKEKECLLALIKSAKCPLCGSPLTFEQTTGSFGYSGYYIHTILKCKKCNVFGVDNDERYDHYGRQSNELSDMRSAWYSVEKYLKK